MSDPAERRKKLEALAAKRASESSDKPTPQVKKPEAKKPDAKHSSSSKPVFKSRFPGKGRSLRDENDDDDDDNTDNSENDDVESDISEEEFSDVDSDDSDRPKKSSSSNKRSAPSKKSSSRRSSTPPKKKSRTSSSKSKSSKKKRMGSDSDDDDSDNLSRITRLIRAISLPQVDGHEVPESIILSLVLMALMMNNDSTIYYLATLSYPSYDDRHVSNLIFT
ncbi:hypothetical protein BCR41DRAFT_184158 [Lobosporangium transversale]|uniref:Uncharacterized protein n=1 Tax=Lobosporangium transversale TaxID=64571 RepID=A0A1Y2H247_9FUNG|nr:hypothetical protein BCR41DRAFT_184158 [Lobosporangium transversale]ORZ27122.1 hypothetical protein BCR41DRAFT_184158 [Lobosporangium transversale]|eukprot:XP_021884869.1 hypothetical protein BCR41DRAFT_184158 [Lobosporangium transversale]